jgi:protein-S-isoprenylcysteine O-methyltransferase Ste14
LASSFYLALSVCLALAALEHRIVDTLGRPIGFAFIVTGFVLNLRQEELMLTEHFGDDYRLYRQEVPALVPHPWLRRTNA